MECERKKSRTTLLDKTKSPVTLGLEPKAELRALDEDDVLAFDREDDIPMELVDYVHVICQDSVPWKHIATMSIASGDVVMVETAVLALPYPTQLVECIDKYPAMKARLPFDRNFCDKQLWGDEDDPRHALLSKAKGSGVLVETCELGEHFAFYPKLFCWGHRCLPSCFAELKTEDEAGGFPAVVTAVMSIGAGEDTTISVLDLDVQSQRAINNDCVTTEMWPLLPVERRRQVLRSLHYIDLCECPRCLSAPTDPLEQSLSGAAFPKEDRMTDAEKRRTIDTMHSDFDAAKTSLSKALAFITKYTFGSGHDMFLHGNHWRMTVARFRVLEQFVPGGITRPLTAKASTSSQPPSRDCVHAVLPLLVLLSKTSKIIGEAHPFRLKVFRMFDEMVKLIPSHLDGELSVLVDEVREDIMWPSECVSKLRV
eukprot:PhM_4_TR10612/c0_g1_i1/m.84797